MSGARRKRFSAPPWFACNESRMIQIRRNAAAIGIWFAGRESLAQRLVRSALQRPGQPAVRCRSARGVRSSNRCGLSSADLAASSSSLFQGVSVRDMEARPSMWASVR